MNAVEFLDAFHGDGFWVLTSIAPNAQRITTETFTRETRDDAATWIKKQNETENLYFSVNQPGRPLTKKADRADIVSVGHLHVDIDTRPGEDFKEDLKRIRALLGDLPCPQPTWINYTGGGYHLFWKLSEPVPIKNADDAERMASYNRQLEIELDGDTCHDISRIMRLPGTLNFPSPRKVQKGRTIVEAEVYKHTADAVYDLDTFKPAPMVQMGSGGFNDAAKPTFAPTGNIKRLNDVDDLDEWKVPQRLKVVIVQGEDPDNPKADDNTRSAWLFDAVCNLVRHGVPDEVIYSVITDPDFDISASVIDKGANVEKYALKQIRSAHEFAESSVLYNYNSKYAVVQAIGNKCRVMFETDSPLGHKELIFQSRGDFTNAHANEYTEIEVTNANGETKKKRVQAADFWFKHPMRRTYTGITFEPGKETRNGVYNLWSGFAVPAVPGTGHEAYIEHVKNNVCRGNLEHFEYIMGWMANTVQNPAQSGQTAIVLRGESGTGKSFFANTFGKLWGRHYKHVTHAKHMVGNFNSHLEGCVVLFADEAFYAGDKQHTSVLKGLITERSVMLERKGIDATPTRNYVHLILASNEDWVVPAIASERRYVVLDVGIDHKQDSAYFRQIQKQLDEGGYASLLHTLMNYDLSNFDLRNVPKTAGLQDQQMRTMGHIDDFWFSILYQGQFPHVNEDDWPELIGHREFYRAYIESASEAGPHIRGGRLGQQVFRAYMSKACGYITKRIRTSDGRRWKQEIHDLEKCRARWERVHGPAKWPDPSDEGTPDLADDDDIPF